MCTNGSEILFESLRPPSQSRTAIPTNVIGNANVTHATKDNGAPNASGVDHAIDAANAMDVRSNTSATDKISKVPHRTRLLSKIRVAVN